MEGWEAPAVAELLLHAPAFLSGGTDLFDSPRGADALWLWSGRPPNQPFTVGWLSRFHQLGWMRALVHHGFTASGCQPEGPVWWSRWGPYDGMSRVCARARGVCECVCVCVCVCVCLSVCLSASLSHTHTHTHTGIFFWFVHSFRLHCVRDSQQRLQEQRFHHWCHRR